MKKSFSLFNIFFVVSMYAMNQQSDTIDWNGEKYKNGNWVQEQAAINFLKDIDLTGKTVLDIGCGTGNITAYMAKEKGAFSVTGIDASPAMIDTAQKTYGLLSNLTFKCEKAETFNHDKQYDIITSFFCLHWIKDKTPVFENIYNHLKPGGCALFTISTPEEESPLRKQIFQEIITELIKKISEDQNNFSFNQDPKAFYSQLGLYSINSNDLDTLLLSCGFTIHFYEQKILDPVFDDNQFKQWIQPLILTPQILKLIPENLHNHLENFAITKMLEKLPRNDEGKVIYPFKTRLVCVCKKS